MQKRCPGCDQDKDLDEFSLAKKGKYGRAYYCRTCARADSKARYHRTSTPEKRAAAAERTRNWLSDPDNLARHKARGAQWAKDNAANVYRRNLEWRKANPDKARAATAKYRKSKPEVGAAAVERRRARLAAAPINDFTTAQWRELLAEFNHACAYCLVQGVPLQQEHMTPLSRGGEHSKPNIVPACKACNLRKGARTLLEFLAAA